MGGNLANTNRSRDDLHAGLVMRQMLLVMDTA